MSWCRKCGKWTCECPPAPRETRDLVHVVGTCPIVWCSKKAEGLKPPQGTVLLWWCIEGHLVFADKILERATMVGDVALLTNGRIHA